MCPGVACSSCEGRPLIKHRECGEYHSAEKFLVCRSASTMWQSLGIHASLSAGTGNGWRAAARVLAGTLRLQGLVYMAANVMNIRFYLWPLLLVRGSRYIRQSTVDFADARSFDATSHCSLTRMSILSLVHVAKRDLGQGYRVWTDDRAPVA